MATKTFDELKQMAIQIRDEKTNKQNTATRIGTQMLEHLNKLEQEYYNKENIDEQNKQTDAKFSELASEVGSKLLLNDEKNYLLKTFSNREEARASVPQNNRKPNLEISYIIDGKIIKERYQSNDISKWENENYKGNWVDDLGRMDNVEQEIDNINILNVSDNFPLSSEEYYTLETAIEAVPSKFRKYGLIIQFYDGNKWNYYQFSWTNYSGSNWNNLHYWSLLYEPNQHLIGTIFKSGQSILLPFVFPIIDINVESNPNSKRIFLKNWAKNSTHFFVQFCDENGELISQYRNTSPSRYPSGYTTLTASELNGSGVKIELLVNADEFSEKILSDYDYWKPIEIVQKISQIKELKTSLEKQIKGVSVFNITSAIPLSSGEYYTFETAIEAVPTEYRKMGLIVQYYDGKKWNYVQFNDTNWVNAWTYKKNWSLYYTPNSHLIGSVFKPNVNLLIPGVDLIPVIDIFTIKNDNNKRIFLKNITNYANNRFTIQFADEEKNLLCQYTTTSNFPTGYTKIRCGELYESGVVVDIVINADLTNAYGTYSDLGYELEIIQKKDDVAELYSKIKALESSTSSLMGTNIVCFGDSITEFTNSDKKGYVEYIQEFTGANVIRGGIGGTRYAQRNSPTLTPSNNADAYASLDMVNLVKAWASGDWSYVDVANEYLIANASDNNTTIINNLKNNPISSVNVVTMFAGTNDLTGGSVIGELNSSSNSEICGAINNIIKMILEANPNIRIFVFTPIVRYIGDERIDEKWSDNWKGTKGSTTTLAELSEIITNCVKQWHIPVCDMYWGLGWNQYNFSNYFIDSDSTHPVKGFDAIARKMVGFISSNRNF